jgi:hypothetical protein
MILVNVAGGTGGAVLRLRVGNGIAQGWFLPQGAGFMPARTHRPVERVSVDDDGEAGWTDLDPKVLTAQPEASFVSQLATVDARTVVSQADDGTELLFLEGADGAWVEVETRPVGGRHRVVQGGPRRLWDLVERTHRWWEGEGRPSWSAFGATVTATDQWVWFRSPDSAHRWSLPVPKPSA